VHGKATGWLEAATACRGRQFADAKPAASTPKPAPAPKP